MSRLFHGDKVEGLLGIVRKLQGKQVGLGTRFPSFFPSWLAGTRGTGGTRRGAGCGELCQGGTRKGGPGSDATCLSR